MFSTQNYACLDMGGQVGILLLQGRHIAASPTLRDTMRLDIEDMKSCQVRACISGAGTIIWMHYEGMGQRKRVLLEHLFQPFMAALVTFKSTYRPRVTQFWQEADLTPFTHCD
jgi:hypothetical protein